MTCSSNSFNIWMAPLYPNNTITDTTKTAKGRAKGHKSPSGNICTLQEQFGYDHCPSRVFWATSVLLYFRDTLHYIRTYIHMYVCMYSRHGPVVQMYTLCVAFPQTICCVQHIVVHTFTQYIRTSSYMSPSNTTQPQTPTRTFHTKTLSPFYYPIHPPPSPLASPHTRVVLPHLMALHNKALHILKEGNLCVDNNLAVELSQDLSDLSLHCTSTHTYTRRDKGSNIYS